MKTPSDTYYFHYYNANPKGKRVCDCAVRALSTAMNQSYADTVRGLAESSIKTCYSFASTENIGKYLEASGWKKHKQPRNWDNTRIRGQQFIEDIVPSGVTVICSIGSKHVSCIIKNQFWDTWDCTDGIVNTWWTKE